MIINVIALCVLSMVFTPSGSMASMPLDVKAQGINLQQNALTVEQAINVLKEDAVSYALNPSNVDLKRPKEAFRTLIIDIKNYKDSFLNANLDIQSSTLSVKQKENSLSLFSKNPN